ncbi:MAG: DUF2267 domain-containing protein [Rhizobiaceae bacterium]|nr:DUF2267 domain-containing protein [Rhizobiaceae bacterium]
MEHTTRLHVEGCRDLIDLAGLATTNQSETLMRAVMSDLRRSIAPSAVSEIANALPALERGILLADWSLDYEPDPSPSAEEFLRRVHEKVKGYHSPPESLTTDVFWLQVQKLLSNKAEAVRNSLTEFSNRTKKSVVLSKTLSRTGRATKGIFRP